MDSRLHDVTVKNGDNFNAIVNELGKATSSSLESFQVKDLATVYLKATAEHCATEAIMQPIIHGWGTGFQKCI